MRSHFVVTAALLIVGATASFAQSPSPNGVKTLAPEGAIKTTGTWDVGTRAGDFVYVAGMRGIDPKQTIWSNKATRRKSGRRSST